MQVRMHYPVTTTTTTTTKTTLKRLTLFSMAQICTLSYQSLTWLQIQKHTAFVNKAQADQKPNLCLQLVLPYMLTTPNLMGVIIFVSISESGTNKP